MGMGRVWEKNRIGQESTQKRMPIPSCIHVFIFPHILGERRDIFLSSILHVFSFFFLMVHARSIIWISPKRCGPFFIILYSVLLMFVVRLSCLQNHVLFWVVCLLLPSSVLLCNGILYHRVSESLFSLLTLWFAVCAYFSLF